MRKDIDFNLTPHPVSGDISIKKDSNAIKQSIKNIVMTSFYERGFNVAFGTDTKGSLFELVSTLEAQALGDKIKSSIKNFEPQAEVVDVYVINNDNNELSATIIYTEFNNPEETQVVINLERLR